MEHGRVTGTACLDPDRLGMLMQPLLTPLQLPAVIIFAA